MHRYNAAADQLAHQIFDYALERVRLDPPPLDGPKSYEELLQSAGNTVTAHGIGGEAALKLWADVLAPATISVDHPRFWSFVASAPTQAATMFDLVVGASGLFGGSWLECAGSVFAENQALRWLADQAGLPSSAGGVFVSGGTLGNLASLVAARHSWRSADPARQQRRGLVAASEAVHSSISHVARVMDIDVLKVPVDERGKLHGPVMREALAQADTSNLFAIVATAGTTNAGIVDDLAGVADVAAEHGVWFHVDGAYGAAAIASNWHRHLFNGIERADSFIVDPHKWLFAPFDCCALVYRDPAIAKAAHTQHAEYLDVLTDSNEWNPSDYAVHLSRRARGLPFWFSLATHGTLAYGEAVAASIHLASQTARLIESLSHVELVLEPELSVVLFRRTGWTPEQYQAWSDRILANGTAFVVPTTWRGETVLRFCFVNPRTTIKDVYAVIETLR